MNNTTINLGTLTASTVMASTFSQGVYPRADGSAFTPPTGFERLTIDGFKKTSSGFAAETFINKTTNEVIIAYRGSDTVGEALNIAAKAPSTGTWNPQFTDATNYAKQAIEVALETINEYRESLENPLPPLTEKDLTPLVTSHSLGGLLGQVVSKMFGWSAEVFDSLGAGKLINTKEYAEQAIYGLTAARSFAVKALLPCLSLVAPLSVYAQDIGKHGADYTYAEGSHTYWRNMHSTRSDNYVFRRDPNIWVYTKEVAKRAGMPLEWASDELKGVAAAAFRMERNGAEEDCGWGRNPKACKPVVQCVLELYFDRQAHVLPWNSKRMVADFDWQDVSTAFHFLPANGFEPAENGDLSRGNRDSKNFPNLAARQPFTDPQTGEELGFAREGNGAKSEVLAYDREIHGRYAFVRLEDGCGRSKHVFFDGDNLQLRRVKGLGISLQSPVFHEVRLPNSWVERIRTLTDQNRQKDDDFYKNIWNQINQK